MIKRYGMNKKGCLDYTDDALSGLKGALDRAKFLGQAEAARFLSEAIARTIQAEGRIHKLEETA